MEYPLTFSAAILEEIGKPLVLRNVQFRGPLKEGQILIKLSYTGICGKQIDEIDGNCGPDNFLPHLLGHEGSGEVLDFGPNVSKVKKGDKVVLHWMKGSGIDSATPEYFFEDQMINAGWLTTFNEYAVVSENRVTITPDPREMEISALCGCVITTSVGVVVKQAKVNGDDNLVIYGCGGVGLCAIQTATQFRPRKIIAVDINPKALERAKSFGASHTINPSYEDICQKINELTDQKGANKVIVCIGNIAAIEKAYAITSIPGTCFLIGVPPKGKMIHVHANDIMHEKNLIGSLGGGTFPDEDIPYCFSLQQSKKIDFKKLITHVLDFEDVNLGIEKVRKGDTGRVILKFKNL